MSSLAGSGHGEVAPSTAGRPGAGSGSHLAIVGTSYRSAPLDVRQRLGADAEAQRLVDAARDLLAFEEPLVLSTCNRVECWGLARRAPGAQGAERVAEALGLPAGTLHASGGYGAYLHAIRVASGMDSAVWGEPQVLGQVRDAARAQLRGRDRGAMGDTLRAIIDAAQEVRARAGLGARSRGAPEATADLLKRWGALQVTVIGTGAAARQVAASAAGFASVTVAGRDLGKAEDVARRAGGRGVPLGEALAALSGADAVVVAVQVAEPVAKWGQAVSAAARGGRLRLAVDLSFPPALPQNSASAGGVRLVDIDSLARIEARSGTRGSRAQGLAAARETARSAYRSARASGAESTIAQLRKRADRIRAQEVHTARGLLSGDPAHDAAVLDKLGERLANRIMHDPTVGLREAWGRGEGPTADRLTRRLFHLEGRR